MVQHLNERSGACQLTRVNALKDDGSSQPFQISARCLAAGSPAARERAGGAEATDGRLASGPLLDPCREGLPKDASAGRQVALRQNRQDAGVARSFFLPRPGSESAFCRDPVPLRIGRSQATVQFRSLFIRIWPARSPRSHARGQRRAGGGGAVDGAVPRLGADPELR